MHWLICQNVQVEVFSPDKNSNRLAKDYFYRIDRKLQKKTKIRRKKKQENSELI